jgi:hypothetical protein
LFVTNRRIENTEMGHKAIDTETEKEEEEEDGKGEPEGQRAVHSAFSVGKLHKHQVVVLVVAMSGTSATLGNRRLAHHTQHEVQIIGTRRPVDLPRTVKHTVPFLVKKAEP